ncbi:hypothetical protein FEK35_27460 [Nocardia cyriacigeorgica]|uniref:DUF1360 domain-containing protein n=1 Tax=Nocardia cyriacigeorgica TaxID=135487 RepID=A0A5R8P697_9NOCA|nr:hypothetical protein [Nocardia cyriacigeorgica]TLF96830.1 hypothetical protein FEK35_27460 [Nocardia cyriacigeorgica]
MTVLILVLSVLAVARATRFIVDDKLFEPVRVWLVDRLGEHSKVAYLVHCTWCSSIWIGFAVAPIAIAATGLSWWALPILALAASQLTGLGSRLSPVLDSLVQAK